jgi:integrase
LDLGRDSNGKRHQKWQTVRGTKRDAQRELNTLLHSLQTGVYVEPTKLTVGEYLRRWLDDCAKTNVAAKTYERYDEIVRLHLIPGLGHFVLTRLQPLHIQETYSGMLSHGRRDRLGGLSARTVLHHHRVLRQALQQAVRWQLLVRNPADAVEPPRPKLTEMRTLDWDEVVRFIELARGTRFYVPIVLDFAAGMRRGEILALRWKDIDLRAGSLAICQSLEQTRAGLAFKEPKTKKSRRVIVLPAFAIETLKRHRAEQSALRMQMGGTYKNHDLVCPRPDGSPWPPGSFSSEFIDFARHHGFDSISFKSLRHTHATLLMKLGIHPKVVSERLGHSTVGMTLDVYSHVLPSMQQDAAEKIDVALRGGGHKVQKR